MLAYYLAASHCLWLAAGNFWQQEGHPDLLRGFVFWTMPCVPLALSWALCWGHYKKPLRMLLALTITTLPPVGLIGWASPLTAAGTWFPGLGWGGVGLLLILLSLLTDPRRYKPGLSALLILALTVNALYTPRSAPLNIVGKNTHLGSAATIEDEYDRVVQLLRIIRDDLKAASPGQVLLYGESVGGTWNYSEGMFARINELAKRKQATVVVGFNQYSQRVKYNIMMSLGTSAGIAWKNRYPVPAGLWRPWIKDSTQPDFSGSGVQTMAGSRVGSLICYEQLLSAPILLTMIQNPQVLIAPSNPWFGATTNLPSIQRQSSAAWARLFNIPIVYAVND